MAYQYVIRAQEQGVLSITLNRPEVLNSCNRQMVAELREAFTSARDDGVRAVLVTGAGRAFCAGQDLAEAVPPDGQAAPDIGDIVAGYNGLIRAIRTLEKPVVCAVNGVAAGAGANIALACDLVLAADTASFIQAFSKIGLVPDNGGTFFLPRLVGMARATALSMLGEKVTAEQAAQYGMIYRVVPRAGAGDAAHAGIGTHQACAQRLTDERPRSPTRPRGGAAARGGSHGRLRRGRARFPAEAEAELHWAVIRAWPYP
jgi:2-(1,2-epoxy-1,2-dihydrophenyl)acetyl-CoA isomerase